MPTNLIFLIVVLIASELNAWMLATAMLMSIVDALLVGCAMVYAWARLVAE